MKKTKSSNSNLHNAKKAKNDEFYTQLTDIEKELMHYKPHFKDKTVFLNCDDPESSNFWEYFKLNFEHLGLKKLIATHYDATQPTYKLEMTKEGVVKTPLIGNGDFRNAECIELLKESDIVVTNPPFSLFREYIAQLMAYEKKFIIMSNNNAITYKEVFPLLKDNKMWLGYTVNATIEFEVPSSYKFIPGKFRKDNNGKYYIKVPAISWFTNLDISKRHQELILFKKYNASTYPKYDNYDAINVDKVADIPEDYYEPMGVPITFLDKHNPEQFEILNANDYICNPKTSVKPHGLIKDKDSAVNGKPLYARILIKRVVN